MATYLAAILIAMYYYFATRGCSNLMALAATSPSPSPSPSHPKEQLVTFVFGDSLTEVGNNNHFQYSLARSDYPWYGVDFPGGQATGRTDDKLLKGVNYASGGAGILNETGLYFVQRLTLDDQIDCFRQTKESIRDMIGDAAANKLANQALYFIGIDGQEYTHDEFLNLLTSTLDKQLTRLYQLGARKVVFHGLGPLGCIPSQRVKSKTGQCLNRVNEWVLEFNDRVKKLVATLNGRFPGSKLIFADTYGDVLDLINNPTSYGFKISNTSCCNVDTSVGGLCMPNANMCKNRKDYVFWDAFHPSDAANQILAEKFFAGLFPDAAAPSP
ncbi:GDSL esterase/lipase At5g37690 [Linum perenne]